MFFAHARLTIALSLCLALLAGSAFAAGGDVGTPAPDFNLQIFQLGGGGGNFVLSQQTGKVILMFVVGYGWGRCIDLAPGAEALANMYPSDQIQAIAIDTWDGGETQVNIFAANANVHFPILMFGGQAGILSNYNCNYDYFFIIGGDGIIKWRGNWNEVAMTAALDSAIAELSLAPVPDVPADGHRLLANYPNPFNPMTRIPYDLGNEAGSVNVRLEILDMRGRLVKALVQGQQTTGQRYEAMWDGTNESGRRMASGTYVSRLQVDGIPQSRFITLVK